MKAFEVERRSEEGPFRKDVGVSPKEEPSCAVTLLEETEDWLDKSFAPPIKVLSGIGRHYLSVSLQQGLVLAHPDGTAVDALGALAEGRAGAADLALGSVASEVIAIVVLERVLQKGRKEEPSCAVTLLEETEDWLDKSFAPPIKVLSGIGRHYLSVSLQQGLVLAHPDGTAVDALGALAEGRAGAADLALGSVASEVIAIVVLERVLVTEHLPLRAKVGVGLGLVGEVHFMVWTKTPAVMGIGHQHLVAGRVAISKVGPRMVSGIGKGQHTFDRSGVLCRRFYHGDELWVVVRPGGHFDSGNDHSGPRATARLPHPRRADSAAPP